MRTDWRACEKRSSATGKPAEAAAAARPPLLANTDMHTGNLGFRPQGQLTLAPAYDILPTLHAPLADWRTPSTCGGSPIGCDWRPLSNVY